MSKNLYIGIPSSSSSNVNVDITNDNIADEFTVANNSYYFVGNGFTFTSNNASKSNSEAVTTLTAKHDCSVTFDYSVSSETNDKLTITVNNVAVVNGLSGNQSGSYTAELSSGQQIKFSYKKNFYTNKNNDNASFSNMKIVREAKEGETPSGVARKVNKMYTGVNGRARKIAAGYVGVNGVARNFYIGENSYIGQQWIYTSNRTFTVPDDGTYTIELHGGGGSGGGALGLTIYDVPYDGNLTVNKIRYGNGGDGGGSGDVFTAELKKGDSYSITIGKGGSPVSGTSDTTIVDTVTASDGQDGGATSFGSLFSVEGGKGGKGCKITAGGTVTNGAAGASSGSLASGTSGGSTVNAYGDGGSKGYTKTTSSGTTSTTKIYASGGGVYGAAIITRIA